MDRLRPSSADNQGEVEGRRGGGVGGEGVAVGRVGRAGREAAVKGLEGARSLLYSQGCQGGRVGRDTERTLRTRVVYGIAIGVSAGATLLGGSGALAVALSGIVWQGAREYLQLINAKKVLRGAPPLPPFASDLARACAAALPTLTWLSGGRLGACMALATFAVLMAVLLQPPGVDTPPPAFSQFSSAVFGMFYCAYLPSLWVKLRALAVPAGPPPAWWPLAPTSWTVGLVSTLVGFACVIGADSGAYLGGRVWGRTPLSAISPNKTVEGAAFGAATSVGVALFGRALLGWPASPVYAAGLALVIFAAALCGDLIESLLKRDAGVKDSGTLIPGHGGVLDRVDSYVFTGALVYFVVKRVLPFFGA
eukprot:jgi/Chlat1/8071/Chrsp75S07539